MFAGRLKLKTFRTLLFVGGALVLIAGCLGIVWSFISGGDSYDHVEPPPAPHLQPLAADGATAERRPVDQVIMEHLGRDLRMDKKKDATPGQPYKVNIYQDAGHSQPNRAKVDLDRDDKWDEKWTIDGDEITRQVAPNDDEVYSQTFVWSETEGWVAN